MNKLKVGKYKGYTFQNAKNKIIDDDPNYINYLKTYITKDRREDLKKNIKEFIEYFENKDILFFKKTEEFIPKINLIKNDSEKITHLIHLSDIHIRLYKRTQEYLNVFNETYENIKKIDGNKLIIITGDILHYKNQLSPECIILTQEFLIKLSKISPVILIAGNHDALLTNQQRVDSISAIINQANIPNLYYFKDTGIYQYNNIAFAVNSLLDNHWIYEKNIPEIEVDFKIALYHGGVGQVETGVGYRLRGEKLVSDFDGYDYVLLGDIHKHQFLTPNMAYAGSLISQNFNEWSYPHGFLIWNLYKNQKKFIKIKNQCGYFIFTIKNNHLFINDDIITIQDIPNYFLETTDSLEIKLFIQNSTSEYIDNVCEKLRNCATDVKIYFSYLTENKEEYQFNEEVNSDFTEILTKLLKDKFEVTEEEEVKFILDKYEELVKENPQLEDKTLNRWEIIDLEFSNMFGYGENNFIDFSRFNDNTVIGLFANNGYGKSSLIDIILFTLFGKISRFHGNGVSKDIINIQKDRFNSKIRFKIGSQLYIIEKEGKREQSGRIKIVKENFFKVEDENIINLVDESRIKTDKLIVKEIGSFDEFIFTNIQLQNRDKSFKDMTITERKEYLYKVFKLNFFEEIIKILSGNLKEINGEILSLKKVSSSELKNQIKSEIDAYLSKNLNINEKIQEYEIEEETLVKNINKLLEKNAKINHLTPEKINSHKIKSSSLKEQCQEHQQSLQNKINEIENFDLSNINIDELENENQEIKKNIQKLQKESLIPIKHFLKKITNEPTKNIILQKKELRNQRGTFAPNPELKNWELELEAIKIYDVGEEDINKELTLKIKEKKIVVQKIDKYEKEISGMDVLGKKINKLKKEVEDNEKIREKLRINNELIEKIKNHEYDPKCKYCIKNPIIQEGKKAQEENQELKKKLTTTTEDLLNEKEEKFKEMRETEKKLIQKKAKLELLNNVIDNLEEKNKKLEENKKNEEIVNSLKEKIREEKRKLEEILRLDKEIEELEQQLELRLELEEIENKNKVIEESNKKIELIKNENIKKEEELSKRIKDYHSKTLKLTKLKSSYNDELNKLEMKEKELKIILDDLKLLDEENIKDITLIEEDRKKLEKLKKELNNLYGEKGKLEEKISFSKEKLEDMETNIVLLEEREKEYKLLKILERALGKDGMPLFLLNQYLPLITENINMIISPFLEREVEISLDGDKILFESYNKHCKEKSVQIHGGMESFMMDLAFKITIGKFAKMPKGDVLFIDEGISALDKDKISNIETLFEFLKNHFKKIILITHIDTVKDSIIEKIEIEKDNNLSQIHCVYSN